MTGLLDSIMWGDVDVVSRCEEMVLRFSSGKMPRRLKQHIEGWWNLSPLQIWVHLEIRCILIQAQASKAPRFVFDDINQLSSSNNLDFPKDSTTRPPGPPTPNHSRCTQTFWEPIRQTFRALWLRLESCNETNVWKLWSPSLQAYNLLSDEERKEEYVWILEKQNPQLAERFLEDPNQSSLRNRRVIFNQAGEIFHVIIDILCGNWHGQSGF